MPDNQGKPAPGGLQYAPLRGFSRVVVNDFFGRRNIPQHFVKHRDEAIAWMIRAQDATKDCGVSYGYSARGGWRDSYVETTGYIATTFFDLFARFRCPDYRIRALKMAHWLLEMQLPDGSFANSRFSKKTGIVFDTGQCLFGLVRAHRETDDGAFVDGANRAADWLVNVAADETGRWTRHTHLGIPHVYNSRTAWALLKANALWPDPNRERVAKVNLDWAVAEEHDGWFKQCAFKPNVAPFTHTIAYAIRGLWEASEEIGDRSYREVSVRAATAVARHVRPDGFLAGQFDTNGKAAASYCCLTGNCQMAIIWAKIYRANRDEKLREAAVRALRYVMSTQDISTDDPQIRGAIKGSQPIWGRYAPFTYPNWATKFYIDALDLCSEWLP